jgi:hypothetical protein
MDKRQGKLKQVTFQQVSETLCEGGYVEAMEVDHLRGLLSIVFVPDAGAAPGFRLSES